MRLWLVALCFIAICPATEASLTDRIITGTAPSFPIRQARVYINGDFFDLYLWSDTLVHYRSEVSGFGWHADTLLQSYRLSECPLALHAEISAVDMTPAYDYNSVFAVFTGPGCSDDDVRMELVALGPKGEITRRTQMDVCWPVGWLSYALALSQFDRGQMFLGYSAKNHIYKSSDSGRTFRKWAQVPYNEPSETQSCGDNYMSGILGTSPFDTNTVFVSGYDLYQNQEILYRTTDNGKTWDSVFAFALQPSTFKNHFTTQRLYFHPRNPDFLYLRLDSALYRSSDSGSTWQAVLQDMAVHSFCIINDRDGFMVGSDSGAVLKSDNGTTWSTHYVLPTHDPVIEVISYYGALYTIAIIPSLAYEIYMTLDVPSVQQQPINVFPNPFSEEITILMPEPASPSSLSILDVFGRTVRRFGEVYAGSRVQWNGTNEAGKRVPAGVYTCVVSNGTQHMRIPIVKN